MPTTTPNRTLAPSDWSPNGETPNVRLTALEQRAVNIEKRVAFALDALGRAAEDASASLRSFGGFLFAWTSLDEPLDQ